MSLGLAPLCSRQARTAPAGNRFVCLLRLTRSSSTAASTPASPTRHAAAVLQDAPAVEVMLEHADAADVLGRERGHRIGGIELAPGQVQCLVVPQDVAIPEVAALVHPPRQRQLPPAPLLVDEDLAGLEQHVAAVVHAGELPDEVLLWERLAVR